MDVTSARVRAAARRIRVRREPLGLGGTVRLNFEAAMQGKGVGQGWFRTTPQRLRHVPTR